MTTHPDLEAEQAYIDHAYERVEHMRATASQRLEEALKPPGSTPQAVHEREIVVNSALHRLAQLEIGLQALCFGRIDDTEGETFYIGRLAVSGRDQEPLVVDWRAPVAEPFYRATGRHAMGLRRRRHFATEGRQITGIEDEIFSTVDGNGLSTGVDGGLELVGTGALLAALERSRSGRMRDIVATVQREQDEIIRAPLAGLLVVQGGPGTGKTAVALHRAAYLLYTFRFPLETQGVLVVGPNPLFLRYIEHVLPSLGETGVSLSTIDGLVTSLGESRVRRRGTDSVAAARVKGDPRMAKVVAKAVRDRQRALPRDVTLPFGSYVLRLTASASAEIVAQVKRRPGTHNARRRQVEVLTVRRLHAQYAEAVERTRRTGLRGIGADIVEIDGDDVRRQLRRTHAFVAAMDRMWPVLTPEELLHDLFGARPLLDLAAGNLLDRDEIERLYRPRSDTLDEVEWTSADLPLLDEARVLLGPQSRTRSDGDSGEPRNYGHIVVDEAQDLSPMQLRVLGRRTLNGSMTIVGDVAQATGHLAPDSWDDVIRHLPTRRGVKMVELTVNYRTPAEIMEVAGRVLAEAAPHLAIPQSVRSTESGPVFTAAPGEVAARSARVAASEVSRTDVGAAAVIAPRSLLDGLRAALTSEGLHFGEPHTDALDTDLALVPVDLVKGLEFDSVVVVEPARIAGETDFGLRALFVALTRATKRLTVVHGEPLPASLTPAHR